MQSAACTTDDAALVAGLKAGGARLMAEDRDIDAWIEALAGRGGADRDDPTVMALRRALREATEDTAPVAVAARAAIMDATDVADDPRLDPINGLGPLRRLAAPGDRPPATMISPETHRWSATS